LQILLHVLNEHYLFFDEILTYEFDILALKIISKNSCKCNFVYNLNFDKANNTKGEV